MTAQARLLAGVPVLVAALRQAVVDTKLTNDELLAALRFLWEVGRADEVVLLSDVLGISRLVDDQTHAAEAGTASTVLGPFYRPGAPEIPNPGSIHADGQLGEALVVAGVVSDAATGGPIPGALLDVWQANGAGVYSNEDDRLPDWHLRGQQRTDAHGRYAIETLTPSHYTVKDDGPVGQLLAQLGRHPWRPAHIHFLVTAEGYRSLVTQAYLAGGPYLEDDTIDGVKPSLIVPIADGRVRFDIALAADDA
jgi:protocatechuate 3,4-dioxygenase beta subunit